MRKIKIEKMRMVDGVPSIQVNLYNYKTAYKTPEIMGLMLPFNRESFRIYKLDIGENREYEVSRIAYGYSPIIPFSTYFHSGMNENADRNIIRGQIMLAIDKFIDIMNNVNEINEIVIDHKFMYPDNDLNVFIDEIIKYEDQQL